MISFERHDKWFKRDFVVLISVLIFLFYFYSGKYWKGKMTSRLNDIVVVSFFFFYSCFNFLSGFLVLISIPSYIV